jgi:hypothetical protein
MTEADERIFKFYHLCWFVAFHDIYVKQSFKPEAPLRLYLDEKTGHRHVPCLSKTKIPFRQASLALTRTA